MGIVIQCAAVAERLEVGRQSLDGKPRNIGRQVKGMRADVAQRAAKAGALGVCAPFGLLGAGPSTLSVSQSWAYSTCTTRSRPNAPSAIICRA